MCQWHYIGFFLQLRRPFFYSTRHQQFPEVGAKRVIISTDRSNLGASIDLSAFHPEKTELMDRFYRQPGCWKRWIGHKGSQISMDPDKIFGGSKGLTSELAREERTKNHELSITGTGCTFCGPAIIRR